MRIISGLVLQKSKCVIIHLVPFYDKLFPVYKVWLKLNIPEWQDFKGVLFPSRTLASMVKGCMPTGKVCVFAPLPRQCANTKLRWEEKGYEVVSLPLLPNATREEAMSAGEAAALHNLDLIILDCISYTNETKRIIRKTAGVPVILGISSAIRCALEMVE